MTRRIDDSQIEDGNIGPPDLAYFNWEAIEFINGTMIPLRYSGTKISGDKDLYWIQDIYRESGTYVPYKVIDTVYKLDGTIRWQKEETLIRVSGTVIGTSGTITGEDGD